MTREGVLGDVSLKSLLPFQGITLKLNDQGRTVLGDVSLKSLLPFQGITLKFK